MPSASVSAQNNGTTNSLTITWSASTFSLASNQTYDVTVSGTGYSYSTTIPYNTNISSPANQTATGLSAGSTYGYTITIRGSQDGSLKASGSGSGTTSSPPSYPPSWSDNSLGAFVAGQAYSDGVAATNMGYSYSGSYYVSSGSLPSGISLNSSTGAVTGTTSSATDYSFTITATNSYGSVSQAFSGTIAGGIRIWDGSAWLKKVVQVWDGSAWVPKTLKVWSGSSWDNSK